MLYFSIPQHTGADAEALPPYVEHAPSEDSMRKRRLYLAVRSARQGAPDLIKGALVATARSAMVVSSVSPER